MSSSEELEKVHELMGETMETTNLVARSPQTIPETGIRQSLLEELALKILYLVGEMTLVELSDRMRLSFPVVDEIFQHLRKYQFCEVTGMIAGVHRITTTSKGKDRALEALSMNQYSGPAPISLNDYEARVRSQSVRDVSVHPPDVQRAYSHMVLSGETLTQLGTAIVSGMSIMLYGPTGTGKTMIAESLPRIYHDQVWIPYAVEVDGQIITVYDGHVHEEVAELDADDADRRWVLCSRPRVMSAGELTIEMLDLQFNATTKFYSAPLQMKANNGILIIDDFGRQRVRPEELLNRWILPLDRKIDYLTLAGGKKFEVPFDLFVAFSTNLDPVSLADEAFLRRIQSKVEVGYINREGFHEICHRVCNEAGLLYNTATVDQFMKMLEELNQPLRPCFPRDIIHHISCAARYEGRDAQFDLESIRKACRDYFLSA